MKLEVGQLVWRQMYSPGSGKSRTYGVRRKMQLAGIVPDYAGPGNDRWWLVDPARPNDETKMSWVESDWCDLEPAEPSAPSGPVQLDIFDVLGVMA